MKTTLLKFSFLLAGLLTAASSYAEDAEIKMTTSAAAGTELRIYSLPYNSATITGADKGEYFGTYLSKGPGTEITITGDIEQLEFTAARSLTSTWLKHRNYQFSNATKTHSLPLTWTTVAHLKSLTAKKTPSHHWTCQNAVN